MSWKGNRYHPISGTILHVHGVTEKNYNKPVMTAYYKIWDLILGCPAYEAVVLPTQPWHLHLCTNKGNLDYLICIHIINFSIKFYKVQKIIRESKRNVFIRQTSSVKFKIMLWFYNILHIRTFPPICYAKEDKWRLYKLS